MVTPHSLTRVKIILPENAALQKNFFSEVRHCRKPPFRNAALQTAHFEKCGTIESQLL
jgi:hypothetical protein